MPTNKTAVEVLCEIEPKKDLLHELMGCGLYAEITRTSDGFFLGRVEGDIGFNDFLGEPSKEALARTKTYLKKLEEYDTKNGTEFLKVAKEALERYNIIL